MNSNFDACTTEKLHCLFTRVIGRKCNLKTIKWIFFQRFFEMQKIASGEVKSE